MTNYHVVCLSGPSTAGKTPLLTATKHFNPEIEFGEVPIIKCIESRPHGARPNEDCLWNDPRYFRPYEEIVGLSLHQGYLVHKEGDNGGSPHALNLDDVLNGNKRVVIETCPTLVSTLKQFAQKYDGLKVVSVFLSPLSMGQIEDLKRKDVDLGEYVSALIQERLDARAKYYGQNPEDSAIKRDNLARAESAINDLLHAPEYDHILVNQDGEGHSNWHMNPKGAFSGVPEGDASKIIEAFAQILLGGKTPNSERWPKDLFNLRSH